MTDTLPNTTIPVFALPVAPPAPDPGPTRPGFFILQEIVRRLPGAVGVTASQAALLNASVQVQASLGRFINITASGLTLFRTSSRWDEVGVAEHGARVDIFRHPPMKSLAPEATMEPFSQLYHAALDLRLKYGAYYRWFDAYFVTFKAERKLVEVFAALEARWSQQRQALIAGLPEIRDWMQRHLRAAAAEAYEAYAATASAPSRTDFLDRALAQAEARFPTPELIESKLRIALLDVLPPDMQPTAEMIETVLGLKESIEAEARAATARAEQAEAEATVAQRQAEMMTLQQQAERDMIEKMHARRLAAADDLLRQEAEAQLAPHLAALQHAREVIHGAVSGALNDIRQGKQPARQRIASLKKAVALYHLVSAGEVDLDDKVAALSQIVQEPAARRSRPSFEKALADIESITAVEAARLQLAGREDEWDALFKGYGDGQEIER